MSDERNRERQREWRHNNPEKTRKYRQDYLRRKYLAEMLAERKKAPNLGKEATS